MGMTLTDILMYEIRQWWQDNTGGWHPGDWLSVGPVNESSMELPEDFQESGIYYVEVRAYNKNGIAGQAARTENLEPMLHKRATGTSAILSLLLN